MIRVMVVDDHPVVAEGVAKLLGEGPCRIVGIAASGAEATMVAVQSRPDVVLLDLRLPDMRAEEVVRALGDAVPGAAILIFTAHSDRAAIEAALTAGAAGFVLKDVNCTDLVDAVQRVAGGERLDPAAVQHSTLVPACRRLPGPPLTEREYDILRRVALGEMNVQIAAELHLAHNTVNTYWKRTLHKLGARNRAEAISKAHEYGLL